jgi:SAM-dependent methyltransferase
MGSASPLVKLKRRLGRWAREAARFGLDPLRLLACLRGVPAFLADYRRIKRQYRSSDRAFPFAPLSPFLDDRYAAGGTAGGHYFHMDLLVAQWVYEDRPQKHVDIGSRVDGFIAHVAAFREVEVLDIRPLSSTARNVRFRQADFTAADPALADYTDSASCLHALEHFGLGRYGDPVDYDGYRRGWDNLYRLVRPGGRLYFAVPMGPQRLEFNGQRVFSLPFLLDMMKGRYRVERFAYVDDRGELVAAADPFSPAGATNFGCAYGCAIFGLVKE